MMSEAIATGRPVGIIPPLKTVVGNLLYGAAKLSGSSVPIRDLTRFTEQLRKQGLAGTIGAPVTGKMNANPLQIAVDAMRSL
jgi:hypothetical protein